MKTHGNIKSILKIFAMALLIMTGSAAANAQGWGRDRDRGHGYKEDRHFYKENRGRGDRFYRGRDHYYQPRYNDERVYYRRAPWGFHRPYVMSHNRGRLYYYGGRYYEYYPNYGYAVVEAPAGYEFDAVPPGFSRVWVDNTWCYHRGDFYLRPSVHGFISFNRPGVSIGANF